MVNIPLPNDELYKNLAKFYLNLKYGEHSNVRLHGESSLDQMYTVSIFPFQYELSNTYMHQEAEIQTWIIMLTEYKKKTLCQPKKNMFHRILHFLCNDSAEKKKSEEFEACYNLLNSVSLNLWDKNNLPVPDEAFKYLMDPVTADILDIFCKCTERNMVLYIMEMQYKKYMGKPIDYITEMKKIARHR